MITEAKNKAVQPEAAAKKEEGLEEFHFSGGGEYAPITIRARDREQAEKIWQEKRSKVAE